MRKYFFIFGAVFLVFSIGFVLAQQDDLLADITYPVAELGNCKDQGSCQAYCDKPENMEPCLDFAEANDLIPQEEINIARKMLVAGQTSGPGGCQGQVECGAYCDNITHIKECVAFAEEHDLMPAEELAEAKKVAEALERGVQPPPCNSKSECDDICTMPENMKNCITFAKEAGLMPPEDLEEAEKVLAALEKGITPPPCGRKDQCDEYCAMPENFEVCITFAEAAGFVSPEEAEMARRTGGRGPGNCRGKDECEAFCEDPAHGEECVNFAEEFGFMSHEEAEMARKMMASGLGLGGPGGCKGKEECEAYCDDISHMTECVDFAEKAGFMSSEDAERARRMAERGINVMQGGPGGCKSQEECEAFCNEPANMEECMNFAVQIGEMTPEEAEQARKGMEMMQRGGLGGCTSEEECRAYCEDPAHGEECLRFSVEMGTISPEEAQRMMEQSQMQPSEGPSAGEAGMITPEGSEEDFERQHQEQYQEEFERQIQQQIEQQIQQQIQQFVPPPAETAPPPETFEAPQSFFEAVKNFLAGLITEI